MKVTKLRMSCPDLRVQSDATMIKEALSNSPGIDRVIVDYEAGIIEATTAAQDDGASIIRLLSNAGYPPAEVQKIDDGDRPA